MTQPIDKIRDSALSATIWKNQGEKGSFYSVTFERTYTDSAGKPKSTSSFSNSELLRIARLAAKAYDQIGQLRAADKAAQQEVA